MGDTVVPKVASARLITPSFFISPIISYLINFKSKGVPGLKFFTDFFPIIFS